MKSSWRTTALGIIAAVTVIGAQIKNALDDDPKTVFDYNQLVAAFAIFGIGAQARDNQVSSERAGAK